MSKLADGLRETFETINGLEHVAQIARAIQGDGDEIPGFDAWGPIAKKRISVLLRSAKYHFAGAEPWQNGEEAVGETSDFLNDEVIADQVKYLAQGLKIGMVPQWACCSNFERLFTKDLDFQIGLTLQVLDIRTDQEAMNSIAANLAQNVVNAANAMRFQKATGKETLHVWDVWYAALGSNSLGMYASGLRLGRKWREQAILDGIAEASKGEVSNDRVADD